jgi:tRNA(fMet)-specific endonuclease VapC
MYVKRRYNAIALEDEMQSHDENKPNIYVLDTNIIIYLANQNALVDKIVNETLDLFSQEKELMLSVVSLAEIQSFAIRAKLETAQLDWIASTLSTLRIADINTPEIIARYVEIDLYSRGKYDNLPQGIRPHKMGKNDLWIAATASVLGATLLTTDQDYMHLNGVYLAVETIPIYKVKVKI